MDFSSTMEQDKLELSDCCCCSWKRISRLCNWMGIGLAVTGVLLPFFLRNEGGENKTRNHSGWWLVLLFWSLSLLSYLFSLLIHECVVKPRSLAELRRAREEQEEEEEEEGASRLAELLSESNNDFSISSSPLSSSNLLSSRQIAEQHRTILQRLAAHELLPRSSYHSGDRGGTYPRLTEQWEREVAVNVPRVGTQTSPWTTPPEVPSSVSLRDAQFLRPLDAAAAASAALESAVTSALRRGVASAGSAAATFSTTPILRPGVGEVNFRSERRQSHALRRDADFPAASSASTRRTPVLRPTTRGTPPRYHASSFTAARSANSANFGFEPAPPSYSEAVGAAGRRDEAAAPGKPPTPPPSYEDVVGRE